MLCQRPNPIEHSSRIKRWGAQLEKHSAFLTVKSLLFTTALFIVSGYALVSYLLGRQDQQVAQAVPVIQMGNACLIFMSLYFVVVDYLFRNRPHEVRLIQRFIWYIILLIVVSMTGIGSILITR